MSFYTLPIILPLLDKPETGKLEFIVTELYKNSNLLSQSEQEHVCSRLNNLLRNYHLYNNFFAIKIINVLMFNNDILSQHGSEFFNKITKVISNINSFNDNNKLVKLVLKTAIKCVQTLLQETRGKPALTRDIVTPNLPGFIGATVQSIEIDPTTSIDILYQIIQSNTTTFRPFGAKFERKIVTLFDNFESMSTVLQRKICHSFVLCKFILVQKNNQDCFYKFVNELLLEIKSVLKIYENFIDLENSDNFLQNLDKITGNEELIFQPLQIDSNVPSSIFQINKRLQVLIQIAISMFETRHNFKISLGSLILINETMLSFNLNFISLKREFKFIDLKNILNNSISQVHSLGIYFLSNILENFEGELVPHFNSLISNLEYSVPVSKMGAIDKDLIIRDEFLIRDILSIATKLLSLTCYYNDYPQLTKLIESSFVLIEPRVPVLEQKQQQQQGKKQKKQKPNLSSSLSDLLSHGGLFVKEIPTQTKEILNHFYQVLITNVSIPATKKTQIVKYSLLELIIVKQDASETLRELLKTILLNPSHDSVNILPFVCEILGDDDEFLSLFINPRLPLLQQTVKVVEPIEEEEEEEEEEDEEEITPKKRKLEETKTEVEEIVVDTTKEEPKIIESSKYEDKIFTKPTDEIKIPEVQDIKPIQQVITEKKETITAALSDDDDSDIEIPDIEMSSDEED